MNKRHERFALEYVVDHNGAQAAIRAGYSERRAKQTAAELLRRPDVRARVDELDREKGERLGIDAAWVVAKLKAVFEKSFEGAPRTTRDGAPVVVRVGDEEVMVFDWSPSGANKALETLAKHFGMMVERSEVEVSGEVVYTLELDRDLAGE